MVVKADHLGGNLVAVKAEDIGNGIGLEMAVANTNCFLPWCSG